MKSASKSTSAFQKAVYVLLFFVIAFHPSKVLALSTGSFTVTGNMITPRSEHTATLLFSGTVLIAGGRNVGLGSREPLGASAELYAPTTGTFSATGNMTTSRFWHSATLLPDGKVLIAGGISGDGSTLASAELYDPSTGAFTATNQMHQTRQRHTATPLNNGKVLIAGGALTSYPYSSLASAELYDSSTGAFTSAGDLNTARFAHIATLLSDGKVLIDGSHYESDVNSSELYDPQTGAFNLIGRTNYGGPETSTLLMNGKVLVTRSVEGGSNSAELYDPSTGAFVPTGEMDAGLGNQYTATRIPDGTILIAGGHPFNVAFLYDPAAGTFSPAAILETSIVFRRSHTATLLLDGAVLIAGGYETPAGSLNSVQLYNPVALDPGQ